MQVIKATLSEKIPEKDKFTHYLISQGLNFIMLIIVWIFLLYLTLPTNARAVMAISFWFIFLYFIIVLFMHLCFWMPQRNCTKCMILLGCISFFFGMIFIGVFFGIFYEQVKREFKEGYNCKIREIQMVSFDGSETYGALGILFDDGKQGTQLLGMGCFSSKKYYSMVSAPYTYKDYLKGDNINCGQDDGKGIYKLDFQVFESEYYKGDGEKVNNDQDYYYNYDNTYQYSYYDSDGQCSYSQDWAEVKIPAWSCIDYEKFKDDIYGLEEQLEYENCFYTPYFSEKGAQNMSKSDKSVLEMDNFYLVTFEEKPYYNKFEFLLFVLFFLVPFISFTHFCWIPFAATLLLQYYNFYKEQKQIKKYIDKNQNNMRRDKKIQEKKEKENQIEKKKKEEEMKRQQKIQQKIIKKKEKEELKKKNEEKVQRLKEEKIKKKKEEELKILQEETKKLEEEKQKKINELDDIIKQAQQINKVPQQQGYNKEPVKSFNNQQQIQIQNQKYYQDDQNNFGKNYSQNNNNHNIIQPYFQNNNQQIPFNPMQQVNNTYLNHDYPQDTLHKQNVQQPKNPYL